MSDRAMKALAYRWTAAAGYVLTLALWIPLCWRAHRTGSVNDFAAILLGAGLVFFVLHLALVRERRRATMRQLPGYILLLLTIAYFVFVALACYNHPAPDFFFERGIFAVIGFPAFLMFPFYGIALFLAWVLHRVFGVSWHFAAHPPHEEMTHHE